MRNLLIGLFLTAFFFGVACTDTDKKTGDGDVASDDALIITEDEEPGDEDLLPDAENDYPSRLFGTAVLNPSGHAPLTAEIPFTPDKPGWFILTVTCPDISDDVPFTKKFAFAAGHTIDLPVLGLHPDCANRVTITLFDEEQTELGTYTTTIATDPLPEDFPLITATGDYAGDAITFFPYYRTFKSEEPDDNNPEVPAGVEPAMAGLGVDKKGRIRWYSAFPSPFFFPMVLIEGQIYGGAWYGDMGTLWHYDFMGYERGALNFGQHGYLRVHHDVVKKPDGNFLITADKVGSDYIEDHIIEIDPDDGSLVHEWDLNSVFPDVADLFYDIPMTSTEYPGFSNDPIHLNSVFYDASDDTLIVASQRSGIAKIRADNGTLVWFFAPHLMRFIDDKNGDGLSDSFVDGYDINTQTTWVGDFMSGAYTEERYPIAGKPTEGYPFEFSYEKFFLQPLDEEGTLITDTDRLMGFTEAEDFRYPFRAHAPRLRPDGTLLLFDNGLGRNFSIINKDFFSRAAIFDITPGEGGFGGTIRQVHEYILQSDPLWHRLSVVIGDADDLGDGTILVTSGALGTAFYPDFIMDLYGDGPRGAYIAQIDIETGEETHSLLIERIISDEYPNSSFSVYRADRVDLYRALPLPTGLVLLED